MSSAERWNHLMKKERLKKIKQDMDGLTREIKKEIERSIPDGWELMAWSPWSHHPLDWFLFRILCKRSDGKEFVTWTANVQSGGCASGNYFRKEALAATDFAKRCGKEAALNSLGS